MLFEYAQYFLSLAGWRFPASTSEIIDYLNTSSAGQQLPIVDLGYALYYNFSNIRFAAPPLGQLRFQAPELPLDERSSGVQDGQIGYTCPQSLTAWVVTMDENGTPLNQTGNVTYEIPPHTADENEDCLFLDVVVPEAAMPTATAKPAKKGAPVLVWIYGGGYIMGSKSYWGNPSGLLAHNYASGREDMIFVSFNYRLGVFGWLAGPSVESDGTSNAGLYDQQMALEWVQKYIHLFGGDPDRVTVMGESAGGGSIITHIIASGVASRPKALFHQAIIQSPGLVKPATHAEAQSYHDDFLRVLNVESLAEARQLSSDVLIRANDEVLFGAPFGQFLFGPAIDSVYLPDNPSKLLAAGKYDQNMKIMLGHCPNEGHQFTPDITTEEEVKDFLHGFFRYSDSATVEYIRTVLYPPIYDGMLPYTTTRGRLDLMYSEYVFTCHTAHVSHVFGNKTYNYQYNNSYGYHTDDVGPTFMNGNESWGWQGIVNHTQASMLQEYITAFVVEGTPNAAHKIREFPVYRAESTILALSSEGEHIKKDPNANARCDFWNTGAL
ncbi:carboxylesterase family protein [Ophiostoma piceae UAMH 11346]|uniref:Carboxylic ester hydrolase n=1 Tax=Ophiostoma piceae (strain UAMH 11346) TaxID=1262450 RepID=S3CXX3_OPHP1|nr:carboxylesterase family protein [Ophiostoma piceae UAMH 11346]